MKFRQVILMKIIKTVATRCQIVRLKCTKIDFGLGSAPDLTEEHFSLPTLPSWNKGDLLLRKREEYREWKSRRGRGREERVKEEKEGREGR